MADIDFPVMWAGVKRKLIDMLDGTHAERMIAQPPAFLLTGTTRQRIRVEQGDHAFFEGRQARTFREFSIGAGATLVLKIVVPVNTILIQQGFEVDNGSLRVTNLVGGTEGGTFSETLPVFNKNNMSDVPTPVYVPQVVFTAGGTHTGGTPLDIHRIVAATATAQQSTVGNIVGDERGVAANTYYIRHENFGSGSATGTLFFIWEERP